MPIIQHGDLFKEIVLNYRPSSANLKQIEETMVNIQQLVIGETVRGCIRSGVIDIQAILTFEGSDGPDGKFRVTQIVKGEGVPLFDVGVIWISGGENEICPSGTSWDEMKSLWLK